MLNKLIRVLALSCSLVVAGASAAQANEERSAGEPAVGLQPAVDSGPVMQGSGASLDDEQRAALAAREAQNGAAEEYEGGAAIYIGGGALIVVLVIIAILVID